MSLIKTTTGEFQREYCQITRKQKKVGSQPVNDLQGLVVVLRNKITILMISH